MQALSQDYSSSICLLYWFYYCDSAVNIRNCEAMTKYIFITVKANLTQSQYKLLSLESFKTFSTIQWKSFLINLNQSENIMGGTIFKAHIEN